MVAVPALIAAGQYDRARQELEFILKYQDQKTGMIWHELSQSAALLDWPKYPYMFVHVDLTFDFLSTIGDYFSATGDQDFVKPQLGDRLETVRCRMRSLGCSPCTGAVRSDADTLPKIIAELVAVRNSERENRVIDHDREGSMELKKREGYF